MEESPQPQPTDSHSVPVEGLARSYSALVGGQLWDTDVGAAEKQTLPEAGAAAAASPPSLVQLLEALLFVGGAPLTADRAAAVIRGLTPAQFSEAIASLNRDYRNQGRPYMIQVQGQGYCLTLRPRYRPVVERLYGQIREARLSPPAVEVLSLVAYRQPVTKQEIDSLRGSESGALIRQLVRRNLVTVVQRGEAGRREICYGTTARFLELFQLSSLDDLPQTADLQRL